MLRFANTPLYFLGHFFSGVFPVVFVAFMATPGPAFIFPTLSLVGRNDHNVYLRIRIRAFNQ